MTQDPHPYLILTLRRTGGTSLMSFMTSVSTFPKVEHEPFNRGRVWSPIRERFQATQDEKALRDDILKATEQRPNIKHCLEVVPLRITRTLIEVCRERGYKFFVLTRRNEADRLISLAIAQATGAWGPQVAKRVYPTIISGELKVPPLVVRDSLEQAHRDAAVLNDTLAILREAEIAYQALVFEEIYGASRSLEDTARDIVASLGFSVAADDPRLEVFCKRGGQGSREIEQYIENVELVRQRLQAL